MSFGIRQMKPIVEGSQVKVFGETHLPPDIKKLQDKGPKYSFTPSVHRQEMLAMVQRIADRSGEHSRDAALSEGVACLTRNIRSFPSSKPPLTKISKAIDECNLVILFDDKESGFSVLSTNLFKKKAGIAIDKNFKQVDFNPQKQKKITCKYWKN
ncbi:hypothetical protein MRX96_032296 [Rhipicephalus microplus]